jgi:low temperature requirement protein LtrA
VDTLSPVRSGADKVRPFELFFDLVFAFSLIQITNAIVEDDDLLGVIHGLVVLAIVWFIWVSFTSLANFGLAPGTRRDWRPPVFVLAMGLMLLVDISIPTAFWEDDLLFAYSVAALFLIWFLAFWKAVGTNRGLRTDVIRMGLAGGVLPLMLIVSAYVVDTILSVVLLSVGFLGIVLASVVSRDRRWPIGREHLSERYELFIIIALGESLISIGLGATKSERTPQLVIAILIAVVLVAVMWRAYLVGVAETGRVRLRSLSHEYAWRFSRIAYVILHLVLAAGIIAVAAGLKVSMKDVLTPVAPLFGGVLILGLIAFLLAIMVFRYTATKRFEWWRLAPLTALLLVFLLAGRAPDIVFLALATAVAAIGSLPDLRLQSVQEADAEQP